MLTNMVDHSKTLQPSTRLSELQLNFRLKTRTGQPVQTWFLVLALLVNCGCFSGCDLGTYSKRLNDLTPSPATAGEAKEEMPKDMKSEDINKEADKPKVVGKWELNNAATVAASEEALAGKELTEDDGTSYVETVQDAVMEFNLAQDGTFTCREVMIGREANYTGDWVLNGNRLDINRKTKNGVAMRDRLVGTVKGDQLDMTNEKDGVKLPFFFKRVR